MCKNLPMFRQPLAPNKWPNSTGQQLFTRVRVGGSSMVENGGGGIAFCESPFAANEIVLILDRLSGFDG